MGRVVAALLSLIWPGLGQVYNRQFARGTALCAIQFILAAFFVYPTGSPR